MNQSPRTIPVQFGRSAHQFDFKSGGFKLHLRNARFVFSKLAAFCFDHQRARCSSAFTLVRLERFAAASAFAVPVRRVRLSPLPINSRDVRSLPPSMPDSRNAVFEQTVHIAQESDFRKRLKLVSSPVFTIKLVFSGRGDQLIVHHTAGTLTGCSPSSKADRCACHSCGFQAPDCPLRRLAGLGVLL